MNVDKKLSIKIMLVDDHKLFIDGLCGLLSAQPDFEVTGKASNGKEALHLLNKQQPDILIMDLNMPILDGEVTSEKIINLFPSVKILVLSMYNTVNLGFRLQKLGIKGYLPKDTDSELLFSVVRSLANGSSYFELPAEALPFENQFSTTDAFLKKVNLTRREMEILKLICQNFSSKEIASKLCISLFTVDTHRKNMMQKLNIDQKTGLLYFAMKHNLV
jgi:DNA-binding NarL/FixJ family response regulator